MRKSNLMKNRKPIVYTILDTVIAVLCVLFVGAAFFAVNMFRETYSYSYSEDSFYYRLEDENFGQLVEMYHTNQEAGAEVTADMKEYYGVAKYFEAASYYKMYLENGDGAKAEQYQKIMEESFSEMGELQFLKETIEGKLGVS